MATIVTRTGKGSALSTAEMDANLTNLNNDKLENIVEDTTPQLGGDLDVQTSILTTSTTNGSIGLEPDGTGAVNVLGGVGINLTATSGQSKIFTETVNADIRLSPNGTGVVKTDKNIDLEANQLITSTTNGDLKLSANGTGKITVEGGAGMDMKDAASITTTSADTDLELSATGVVFFDSEASFGGAISETVYTSTTTTGTYAPDAANGTIHYVVLSGNMTINGFTNAASGQSISFLFDGTGGAYTLTLGGDILQAGGDVSLTSGGLDVVTITCVETVTPTYIATAVNNFQ